MINGCGLALGLDSTNTVDNTGQVKAFTNTGAGNNAWEPQKAVYIGTPAEGYHYLQALEYGAVNRTFVGTSTGIVVESGLLGVIVG